MIPLARRVQEMDESVTLAASAKAKALKAQGKDILELTLGQPDFVTPSNIQDAAIQAIRSGEASFYTGATGLPKAKEAVAQYVQRYYGFSIDPTEVLLGTGGKFVLYTFFATVLDPGDEVLIPTPCWVSYVDQVKMNEGIPVLVPASPQHDFKVTVQDLEAARTPKTKVLLLNSPSNPTGSVYSAEELEAIGNWAVAHDLLILVDDMYSRLVYNGCSFTSMASISETIRQKTLVVNGLSKTYAMTGWRVGFAFGPQELVAAMSKVISQTTSNLTAVSQYAAIEALTGPQDSVEEMRQAFEERLNRIYPLVAAIPGFQLEKPQGAFYLFVNVEEAMCMKGFTDTNDFTEALLQEAGVAVVTGEGFGAPGYIRISYATDLETLYEAVERLTNYMTK